MNKHHHEHQHGHRHDQHHGHHDDHEHDHEHEGAGPEGEEIPSITLVDEDGSSRDFIVWDNFEVESTQYLLLEPAEPEEGEEGAWFFRVDTDADGQQTVTPVTDDEEAERVRQAWEELNADD
ncbi:MAG TPA: DUF1292 domain-containing protein [Limnochordales bacterium]